MLKRKAKYIIGVDEAGRGPVAGPVCVGLVLMKNDPKLLKTFNLTKDSKQLTKLGREKWFAKIHQASLSGDLVYKHSFSSNRVIDQKGIVPAIKLAIKNCFKNLNIKTTDCEVLLDGLLSAPENFKNQKTIIRGDETESIIGLASVVAKVSRDKKMTQFSKKYSKYGWETNMGYGTKKHYLALKKEGLTPLHRQSFLHG